MNAKWGLLLTTSTTRLRPCEGMLAESTPTVNSTERRQGVTAPRIVIDAAFISIVRLLNSPPPTAKMAIVVHP
jgi:hypothetical protein